MKSLSASHIKQSIGAVFLLLASLGSHESYASVIFTDGIAYSDQYIFLPPDGVGVCLAGESCVISDAVWAGSKLTSFQVGEQVSISASRAIFSFYLGNSLNGKYEVSLAPAVTHSPFGWGGELLANIANRSSILSTTNVGMSMFEASSGNDYYLLLSGFMLGDQTYQLQVSKALPAAIPVPAAGWLFASGLSLLMFNHSRKNQNSQLQYC